MNQKGNLVLFGLLGLVLVGVVSFLIIMFVPQAAILMRIVLVFAIFMTVRGAIGDGTPTLLISAILIYFLAFKYFELAAAGYVVYFMVAYTGTTLFSFGLRFFFGKH
ncbi:MAG: hypothetical protein J4215_02635 [Candidatus Diapherotrites archaeon]|uniref:Uncharacterized protein n=1 Tax=Candidatus Iainarchaeum sp. TaxID=3101447 RepID=A0A8T4L4I2_9ARCH|nr:hypothetical protein [Candidatus Diapherotrites archaeon]